MAAFNSALQALHLAAQRHDGGFVKLLLGASVATASGTHPTPLDALLLDNVPNLLEQWSTYRRRVALVELIRQGQQGAAEH